MIHSSMRCVGAQARAIFANRIACVGFVVTREGCNSLLAHRCGPRMHYLHTSIPIEFSQSKKPPNVEEVLPKLDKNEFVVFAPEVSATSGMAVSGELGQICELAVKEGDYVKEDAVVAVIETVKASVEARCRASGIVKRVLAKVGDMVFESQPLYVMEAR